MFEKPGVEKSKKKQKLPDIRRFNVVNGMAEEDIRKTEGKHICGWCGRTIETGSPARRFIPIADRKVLVNSPEVKYVHVKKEDCVTD